MPRVTQEDHQRFIASLEARGSNNSGQEWDNLSENGWTTEESRIYAYRYMNLLYSRLNASDNGVDTRPTVTPVPQSRSSCIPPPLLPADASDGIGWNKDECVLFDTLLACHGPPGGDMHCVDGDIHASRWEKIAAMIPDKTPSQCKNRYLNDYLNEDKLS